MGNEGGAASCGPASGVVLSFTPLHIRWGIEAENHKNQPGHHLVWLNMFFSHPSLVSLIFSPSLTSLFCWTNTPGWLSPGWSEGCGGTLGGEGAALLEHPEGNSDPTAILPGKPKRFEKLPRKQGAMLEGAEPQSVALPPQGKLRHAGRAFCVSVLGGPSLLPAPAG